MGAHEPTQASASRRGFLALLASGVAGVALAACGATAPAQSSTAATGSQGAAATAAVTSQSAASAAPAANKAQQTVKFRSWWNPSISQPMDAWDKFIRQDFPAKHNGAALTIEYVPFGDYFKKFLASVAGGDVPDVLHTSVAWGRDFYDLGTFAELDGYMGRTADMDPKKLIPVTNLYNQKAGKYYGASWEGPDGACLYYNVDLFKQAGIDPSYDKVKAWTWNDLVTNAGTLTKRQGDTVTLSGFLVSVLGVDGLASWIYTTGAKFYGDAVQSKAVFGDNGKGAQVAQFHLDLLNKYKVSEPLGAQRQDTNLFYQGKTAILSGGLWAVSKFQTDAPKLNFDLAPLPKGPGGAGPSGVAFANMHAIPGTAKNKDGGWEFISWYNSLDTAVAKLKLQGMPSPRTDFYDTPEWKDAVKTIPQRSRVPDIAGSGDVWPFARYSRVQPIFDPAMQAMMLRKTPPTSGMADLQKQVNDLLAQPPQS